MDSLLTPSSCFLTNVILEKCYWRTYLLFAIKSQSISKWVLISKPILNTVAELHFMEFFEGDERTNTGSLNTAYSEKSLNLQSYTSTGEKSRGWRDGTVLATSGAKIQSIRSIPLPAHRYYCRMSWRQQTKSLACTSSTFAERRITR